MHFAKFPKVEYREQYALLTVARHSHGIDVFVFTEEHIILHEHIMDLFLRDSFILVE